MTWPLKLRDLLFVSIRIRVNLINIMNGLRTGRPRFDSRRTDFFSFSQRSYFLWVPLQLVLLAVNVLNAW